MSTLVSINNQVMETNQSHIEFVQDDASNMSYDTQKEETVDLDLLLEKIETIDDLDVFEEIENVLLKEKQYMTEAIDEVCKQNAELKDELNRAKCFIQELDQLHSDEVQKIDNLMKMILIKQNEVAEEQAQQVDDLDHFEEEVSKITHKLVTAPKEYESSNLKEKTDHLQMILEAQNSELQQLIEEKSKVQAGFEEPILMPSMELASTILDDASTELTSSNKNWTQKLEDLTKEAKKLKLSMMTNIFRISDKK